jgi:predicted ATPase
LKYEYDILPFPHAGYQGQNAFQILSGDNLPVDSSKAFNPEDPGLLLSEARTWLDFIIPGASFENADAIGRSRVIEGTYGESLPTNVGFGISYVLPIIVNGLLAEPNTYFIIENPEAHVHPFGQSRIGKFLAQVAGAGVNVVIETHSEHVINGIRLASLTGKIKPGDVIVNFVTRPEDETSPVREIDLTDFGDLTAYPKGFFDQEQADIAAIIREKRKKL